MRTLTQLITAAAFVFAMAAPVSASVSSDISRDVRIAAGSGSNVRINVEGDTVTLTGYVEDSYALQAIEAAALKAGATKVNNRVIRSR